MCDASRLCVFFSHFLPSQSNVKESGSWTQERKALSWSASPLPLLLAVAVHQGELHSVLVCWFPRAGYERITNLSVTSGCRAEMENYACRCLNVLLSVSRRGPSERDEEVTPMSPEKAISHDALSSFFATATPVSRIVDVTEVRLVRTKEKGECDSASVLTTFRPLFFSDGP